MRPRTLTLITLAGFICGYLATFAIAWIAPAMRLFHVLMDVLCPVCGLITPPLSFEQWVFVIAPLNGLIYASLMAALCLALSRLLHS